MSDFLLEPARRTPICWEGDLCVLGGSCTGVFAAVRAARLGLKVAVVEGNSLFGGMAVAAQVHHWHRCDDVPRKRTIIAGLTAEVIERLRVRGAVHEVDHERIHYKFNSAELAVELDDLVRAHGIRPFLRAQAVAVQRQDRQIRTLAIEDKSGRRALRARFFIDASGDGDLLRAAGLSHRKPERLQPANLQALVQGLPPGLWRDHSRELLALAPRYGYPTDNSQPWPDVWAGIEGVQNVYGPRLNGVDASDADQLTGALIEGRRQHRALHDLIAENFGARPRVVAWAQALGVRQTYQAECHHRITEAELLAAAPFPDAIAQGTYPVDVHTPAGTLLRYLDGREEWVQRNGDVEHRRWRPASAPSPSCYHVPYRSLVPRGADNLLIAGRLIDADREAYGGLRVMVNCNQTGEAAGVAAALALAAEAPAADVNPQDLRRTLNQGGSVLAT